MRKNNNWKFKAGISLVITSILLLSGMSTVSGIIETNNSTISSQSSNLENSFMTPHPIFGTATWDGGGNADDATVEVYSTEGTLDTIVGPSGGWGSGEWQVDCGDPGPNWPDGTAFTVFINGTEAHEGWKGSASGSVSGNYNNMGNIVVYQNNTPPNQPSDPNPYDGETGVDIDADLSWSCNDPDGDSLTYDIYFGTSSSPPLVETDWIQTTYDPGTMIKGTTYRWMIKAKDEHGATTEGPIWSFTTYSDGGQPPGKPIINGPIIGRVGISYSYTFLSIDPDGDDVYYNIDWGDGNFEDWFGPYHSNEMVTKNHTWSSTGLYKIRARAKDINGNICVSWTDHYIVMGPAAKQSSSSQHLVSKLLFQIQ